MEIHIKERYELISHWTLQPHVKLASSFPAAVPKAVYTVCLGWFFTSLFLPFGTFFLILKCW